jgi:hypothetical protein
MVVGTKPLFACTELRVCDGQKGKNQYVIALGSDNVGKYNNQTKRDEREKI